MTVPGRLAHILGMNYFTNRNGREVMDHPCTMVFSRHQVMWVHHPKVHVNIPQDVPSHLLQTPIN